MMATLATLALAAASSSDWCKVEVPEIDSPSSRVNYSVALEPTGGEEVVIDVLFYYLEDEEVDLNGRTAKEETARWIELANLYLSRGTSGLQLRSAAVLPMPSDVRAEFSLSDGAFGPAILAASESPRVESERQMYGGDLVTFIAYDKKRWLLDGQAILWENRIPPAEFRRIAMNGVVWGSEMPDVLFLHEVGHTLGLDHHLDSLVEGRLERLFDRKGLGYYRKEGTGSHWGTIMAAGVLPTLGGFSNAGRVDLPLAEGSRHRWEPHWSYLLPAGDRTADADRALRKTIGHAAAFYDPPGDEDGNDDDDPPPPTTGPKAAIGVDVSCPDGLCRAVTGTPVSFEDQSTGTVGVRRWDFYGVSTSRETSLTHVFRSPGFHDVSLTVSHGAQESTASLTFLVEASHPAGTCEATATALCLRDSRYEVSLGWWTAYGQSGDATVARVGTNDSGIFWFFSDDNWEVLVKVLDGCGYNGHDWVYAASVTTVGLKLTVLDTKSGESRSYAKEAGKPASAITDTHAFGERCTTPTSESDHP